MRCSEGYSIPVGWTDHNIVRITINTRDLAVVPWELVYLEDDLDHATEY